VSSDSQANAVNMARTLGAVASPTLENDPALGADAALIYPRKLARGKTLARFHLDFRGVSRTRGSL